MIAWTLRQGGKAYLLIAALEVSTIEPVAVVAEVDVVEGTQVAEQR